MPYTTIDDPTIYFNTKLYTGNGSNGHAITGVGFQPDWVWIKGRSVAENHNVYDSVRGAGERLIPNGTNSETTKTDTHKSFDSDGFTLDLGAEVNDNAQTFVSWNWLAGGTAPSQTYTVKVVSDSGNKYRFDDFGTSAVTLDLQEGGTYTFDQSDSSNSGHPLRFSTTSDGTHGGGSEFTTNVTTTGTPGSAGAKTVITVASGTATLYYYCTQHSGMGGQANTNSTFGSSNFSGGVQSIVSANTTSGFSIVKFTSSSSSGAMTVGHGLGATPQVVIVKDIGASGNWQVYFEGIGTANQQYLKLNATDALVNYSNLWGAGMTSSLIGIGVAVAVDASESDIAYCFAEKKGYSKFGTYTGNGNADGTFIYTGFKPAFFLVKNITNAGYDWELRDNKRDSYNPVGYRLEGNTSDAESSYYAEYDFVSNGIKIRQNGNNYNTSGASYIYMAFAENPFVNSNGVPNNAR